MTSHDPTAPRLLDVSGAEALWLLGGTSVGRLVFTSQCLPAIRPARHVLEHGTLIVRAPIPSAALTLPGGQPAILTYHADQVDAPAARGWSVTATGGAEPVTDPHAEAHYRRVLTGWVHGPHDTVLRLRLQATTGHRLGRPAAAAPDPEPGR